MIYKVFIIFRISFCAQIEKIHHVNHIRVKNCVTLKYPSAEIQHESNKCCEFSNSLEFNSKLYFRSLFTGLKAVTHFGRPNFSSIFNHIALTHEVIYFSFRPQSQTVIEICFFYIQFNYIIGNHS